MADMARQKKIPSKFALNAQFYGGLLLFLPSMLAAMLSVICWTILPLGIFGVISSVPEGRHDVLVAGLITLPAIVIAALVYRMVNRSMRLLDYYYETMANGRVSDIDPKQYQVYAVVTGLSNAGRPMTKKIPVPVEKIPTLRVGDTYPW